MNLLLLVLHYSIAIVVWHSTSVVNGLHHKLTKRELVKTFGVDDHKHVPEYQLIKTVRKFGPDGKLKIMEFSAWNSTFEIELKPNMKLVSPKVVSVIRGENGTVEEFQGFPENVKTDCHYHGEVKSHGKIKAAVSSCRELMGVIAMEDHFLMLQTIPERIRHHQEEDHLIYKRQAALLNPLEHFSFNEEPVRVDLNEDENTGFCDVSKSIDELPASVLKDSLSELNSINYTLPSEAKLDSLFIFPQHDPITLEIGLFLDSKLYEHFDREFTRAPDQHLTDFALALINNVHVLYQQPTLTPNLDIVIVRFEMWKQQPSPLVSSVHKSGQAQTLLDAFCRYQARINPGSDLSDPGHWDHGVLLTGYDIYHMTSSVAGVAPVARMCDDLFACSLVEGLHLGRSFVLAHEMGHNMGMVHDGVQNQCGRSCCLMSAVNGAGKTTWSTCSVREFNAFLLQLDESGKGNCLRDPAVSIGAHDHLADGRLPGQRFTADQQCSYFWGRDYQVEIPNGRNMDDICRILWCGNSGSTISTAHPALEGSFCGPQKWCQEGICQPWKQPMKKPEVIHGGWSDWSSNQDPCPITPCQITGGISIKPQLRTCTEPAPNNGGRSCRGSNMRGIVCGKINSNCLGLTRQEFGDRLCTAIRNDPTRPDRQLSGKSFLHQTQACKIWCHVDNSELIRNKGQFPNGTPCGPGQYCVSGSCLSLSCNDKALVSEDKDCPPAKSKSSLAKWGPWSQWSNCPVTCAKKDEIPLQRRTRKCQAPSPLCDGKTVETRPCTPLPPVCEEYSSWTEWSQCTKSCGGGKMTRKRQCTSGENCSQKLVDIKNCGEDPCPNWNEWDHWSSCSASCGPGQRSRRRTCSVEDGCEGEGSQITTCVGEHCMEETWGEWLPCSVTCGIGFQLRERLCDGVLCAENSKQARTCNVQDCPRNPLIPQGHLWSQWSSWSPCSATCGEGLQKRTRTCITGSNCPVVDSSTQEKRCVLGPCPSWTPWGDWNAECSTCSVLEIRSRERECKISFLPGFDGETVSPEQCGGLKVEIQNCDQICKTSEVHKKVESETVSPLTAILPSPDDSEYGPWQDWLPCSVTCGGGLRERIRFCPEDKDCSRHGLSFELEECNKGSCEELESTQWTEWSDWSSCNVVCGGGRQFRSRKCKALFVFLCDGANKEEKPCNTDPCGASSQRTSGVPTLLLDENEDLHPKWSSWSSWSRCSCFTLTQFRRRFCQIQDPTVQGFCAGSIIDQRKCEPEDCAPEAGGWSEWSSWSRCSKECGSPGHQIRNRMCSDPLPSNRGSYCIGYSFDQKPCEPSSKICFSRPVDGSWTEWTSWSECSNPCENGQKSRTRYCSNPRPQNGGKQCLGSDFELKSCADLSQCNKSVDGSWSPWSSWSSCNGTCGVTFKSRSRTCSNPPPENGAPCSGLARQTTICNTKLCSNSVDGIWSTWSPWSPCTADCKAIGTRTRTRICSIPRNGGLPCFGKSAESQPCQPEDVLGESFCDSALRHEQALEAAFMTRSIR